jgi:hypothetical protein
VFGVVTLAIGLSHALVDLRAGNGCYGKSTDTAFLGDGWTYKMGQVPLS